MCFNPMSVRGAHTIARPFNCQGGVRHAVCRACDQRMFQGHDDRCPTCRAPRSGISIAENGMRPPGIPVHERRPENDITLEHFWIPDAGDEPVEGYISVLARPGTDDVFASLEEMLADRGISRARIVSGNSRATRARAVAPGLASSLRNLVSVMGTSAERPAAQDAGAAIVAAVNAMRNDPQTAAALDGLSNPVEMPLGTFLDRVRGTAAAAEAQSQTGRSGGRRFALVRSGPVGPGHR